MTIQVASGIFRLWNATRECYITILHPAMENTVGNIIKATIAWHTMERLDVIPSRVSCIRIGCTFSGINVSIAYRGFCSSSSGSVGSGVLVAPLSLSFLPDGLFTSVFSPAAKVVALSLPPDFDEADCGLPVSGSSTRGKRVYSLIASHGILPDNDTEWPWPVNTTSVITCK